MTYDTELKQAVARRIQTLLKEHNWADPEMGFTDVLEIEVQDTDSPLSTVVRVKTQHHGTHYFEVRVKGMI